MATNYARGRAFEYRARDRALARGAIYVMRAASSKGAADLIVLWPHPGYFRDYLTEEIIGGPKVWLVQVKRDGRLPKAERETLIEIAEKTGAIPVLARVPKTGLGIEFINLRTMEVL